MTIEQLQQQLDSASGTINRIVTSVSGELMGAYQRIAELEAQLSETLKQLQAAAAQREVAPPATPADPPPQ